MKVQDQELLKDGDRFSLEAENEKKNMEEMKPVVVIKVKFFQTNSNRETGSNERV